MPKFFVSPDAVRGRFLTLDGENWRKLAEIPEKCRYLELSGRDDFSRAFTDSLTF